MRTAFLRAVCLLLALLAAMGCAACAPAVPQEPAPEGQRLEILQDPVTYSAELIGSSAARTVDLLARILFLADGMQMSAADKQSVRERIEQQLLPACMRARIYPEQLTALLTLAEECCAAQEDANLSPAERIAALSLFYGRAVALIGSDRAGKLCYELTSLYLNAQISLFEQRYRDYGYVWYLQDAERYRAKAQMLHESLGAENFSHAVQVFLFLGSLASGIAPDGGESIKLYDAELLLILRRQASHFAGLLLTAEQWTFMAELLSDAVPDTRDRVWSAELAVLYDLGRIGKMAATVPQLLELYRAFAEELTERELAALREGNADAVICGALLRCRAPLERFLNDFSAAAAGADAKELAALAALGQSEAIALFLAQNPALSTESLLAALDDIAAGREDAPDAWASALRRWLCGVAPYMTFAISTPMGSVQ